MDILIGLIVLSFLGFCALVGFLTICAFCLEELKSLIPVRTIVVEREVQVGRRARPDSELTRDAVSALMNLGYKKRESTEWVGVVMSDPDPPQTIQDVIFRVLGSDDLQDAGLITLAHQN